MGILLNFFDERIMSYAAHEQSEPGLLDQYYRHRNHQARLPTNPLVYSFSDHHSKARVAE